MKCLKALCTSLLVGSSDLLFASGGNNTITLLPPVAISTTNSICGGSNFNVYFESTGLFAEDNVYQVQLSNSDGSWGSEPAVVGILNSSTAFDPQLGWVSPAISCLLYPYETSCNYYLRVTSSSPSLNGSEYGPFCITSCGLIFNDMQNIHVCINECGTDSDGETYTTTIEASLSGESIQYLEGNTFTTQLFDINTLAQIGPDGLLGEMVGTEFSAFEVHLPCNDSLEFYNIPTGESYLRIIATNSSEPENALSAWVKINIGAYINASLVITSYNFPLIEEQNQFCTNDVAVFMFEPFDFADNYSYEWVSPSINQGDPFFSPGGTNSNTLYVNLGQEDTLSISVQATNNGCVSEWSDEFEITVFSTPQIDIEGPLEFCEGDTVLYAMYNYASTTYSWETNASLEFVSLFQTAYNELQLCITEAGTYNIAYGLENICGSEDWAIDVVVHPLPTTPLISNTNGALYTESVSGNTYQWFFNDEIIEGANDTLFVPLQSGLYSLEIMNEFGCSALSELIEVIVGVDETSAVNHWLVYPNPAHDQITIDLADFTSSSLVLYDASGRKVRVVQNITSPQYTMPLDLAAGVYTLCAVNEGIQRKVLVVVE